jgi:SsrA-binding protein
VLAVNKKARFDYEIVESFEAGIVLTGAEVKAIHTNTANLTGSRVVFKDTGAYVVGMNIPKYKFDSNEEYDPLKTRKLLLHKKEMVNILTKTKAAGLTLVPIKLYNKGGLVKVEIALVRGKKRFEKREELRKRDVNLGLARRLKISR